MRSEEMRPFIWGTLQKWSVKRSAKSEIVVPNWKSAKANFIPETSRAGWRIVTP